MPITLNGDTGITTPGLTNTGSTTLVNLTTTGNTILGDQSTDTLNVANGNLVLNSSGNLGVGTSSINTRLHVVGLNQTNGTAEFTPNASKGSNASYVHYGTNGDWYIRSASASGNVNIQDTGGNVGIGTASPNGKVTVIGNTVDIRNTAGAYGTGYALEIATNATIPRLDFIDNSVYTGNIKSTGGVFIIQNSANAALTLGTNNTERARIDSSGNFLVGTTSANAKVKIALTGSATTPIVNVASFGSGGVVSLGSIANNSEQVYLGTGDTSGGGIAAGIGFMREASGWNSALSFYTNNVTSGANGVSAITERARITSSGNLLLGTTSDQGRKLQVSGAIALVDAALNSIVDMSVNSSGVMSIAPYNGSGSTISFSTNPSSGGVTERARIHSAGGMSIGTSTAAPASGLRVSGATNPAGGIVGSNLIMGYVAANYTGTRYWLLHRMQTGAGVEQSAFNCMGDLHASSWTTWNLSNLWIRREYASTNVFAGITGVIKSGVTVSVVDITYSNVRYVAIKFAGGDPGIEANLVGYSMDQMYTNGTDASFINGTAGVTEIAVIATY